MATNRNLNYGVNERRIFNGDILPYCPASDGNAYNSDYCLLHNEKDLAPGDHETRFINPAIYVEPLNANYKVESVKIQKFCNRFIETDCGDAAALAVSFPHLSLNDDLSSPNACRSQSTISSVTHSSKSTSRVERRCKIEDINDKLSTEETLHYSSSAEPFKVSSSLSTSDISARQYSSRISLPRQLAHEKWIQKKKSEAFNQKKKTDKLKMKEQENEKKLMREQEERERREQENFAIWKKRKNQEDIKKRKLLEKEKELAEKLKEIEEKATIAKEICLLQWSLTKDKAQKAQKDEQERKLKQLDEEKKKRMEESIKAFEEWQDKTKNTPRPATQGLLPHQKAKPTYINPIPWITDNTTPEISNKLQKTKAQDAKKFNVISKSVKKNA